MASAQQTLTGQAGGAALADVLWMYGGISQAEPLNYSAELWGFTASSGTWQLQPAAQGSPPPLVGSAMCAVGHFLYLYGGANFAANAHADLYAFDTTRRTWARTVLPGASNPPARAYHAMSCLGGSVHLFGGQDASGSVAGDLYVLSNLNTISMSWSVAPPLGNVPTARKGHTLAHGRGTIYLFGGSDATGAKLADTYALDAVSLTWAALATSGDAPAGREGHTATVLDDKLYVFGGADGAGKLNDVRALDLGTLRWSHPAAAGVPPAPRWGHVGALINQRLYLYGGVSVDQTLLSDLWSMSRHCLGRLPLSTSRGSFISGEGAYLASSYCEWHIKPSEPSRQVRLYFSSFGFEAGKDFVSVYDGPNTTDPLLARFTGAELPPPLASSSGELLVVMETDDATNDIGFAASYFDECTAGYVRAAAAGTPGSEQCEPCAAGSVAATSGLAACTRCDAHQYQPASGQAGCLACPAATRAAFTGATALSDCTCYPGFFAPNGTGTACVACPLGATCPGSGVGALALPGFCRNSSTLFAPCCDAAACPGGAGAEATCPPGGGATGTPGTMQCVERTILTMGFYAFYSAIGAVSLAVVVCFLCGRVHGKRVGASRALRDYAHRLRVAAAAPQIGSYTSALAADTSLQPEPMGSLLGGRTSNGSGSGAGSGAGLGAAASKRAAIAASDGAGARVSRVHRASTKSLLGNKPQTPAACSCGYDGGYDEVGVSLVELDGLQSEEAHLVPPSASAYRDAGRGGSAGSGSAGSGGGGPPVMHLAALQDAEAGLIPPSTAGGSSRRGGGVQGNDLFSPENGSESGGGDDASVAASVVMPPPTPPRVPKPPPPAPSQPPPPPGGTYVGTCLVQVPDETGRWQPVKLTASMAGSPVGSINPSLAPSESTLGGRSLRMMRGAGAMSIPEDDELDLPADQID